MPVSPTYPGIYIEELPSSAHTITAAPTSITVFVGYTHPFKTNNFNKPVRIFSFADYEREFGGLYQCQYLDNNVAYAVQQFFLNGGADAYVVGLQPQVPSGSSYVNYAPAAASFTSGSITTTFTAREPTDPSTPMMVVISNQQTAIPAGSPTGFQVADITISYGTRTETYRGVSLDSNSPNYIEKVFGLGTTTSPNKSALVTLSTNTAGSYANFPVGTGGSTTTPKPAPYTLAYPSPQPLNAKFLSSDFTSILAPTSALDKVDIFNLVLLPGVSDPAALNAAVAFCEYRRAFLIMDVPSTVSSVTVTADHLVANLTSDIASLPTSPNSAVYFPYLQAPDPLTGNTINLPPSGFVAGIFARTDQNRGVWKAPAGLETTIRNTIGVIPNGVLADMQAGVLNDGAVNALRTFPGVGTVVFGARTIVGGTTNTTFQSWRYVPVRRMALFIEQTLYRNLGWVIFEPNDVPLWTAIKNSIERFMLSLFRQGAFQGSTPSEAFLVQCDASTTTQDDIDNGKVNIIVGFRPLKPAEFVIVKITQLAGQVQA